MVLLGTQNVGKTGKKNPIEYDYAAFDWPGFRSIGGAVAEF